MPSIRTMCRTLTLVMLLAVALNASAQQRSSAASTAKRVTKTEQQTGSALTGAPRSAPAPTAKSGAIPKIGSAPKSRDSIRTATPLFIASGKRLPPSMLAELRRSQTGRALAYHDTVRAAERAREHLNDSVEQQFTDSALVILDTAVSIPHKEWLDSELVEVPELSRFGDRVHFNYPPSMMVETDPNPVPFDTTLLRGMNPISRENLPFFDQSPIPLPLAPARAFEGFLEAGGGNVDQPLVNGWLSYTFSPRTAFTADVRYDHYASLPIQAYFKGEGSFNAQLGEDPGLSPFHSSDLTARLGYTSRLTEIHLDSSGAATKRQHTSTLFEPSLALIGDASDRFHYEANLSDHELHDDLLTSSQESSQNANVRIHYDPYISHFRFLGEAGYMRSGLSADTAQILGNTGAASTSTISAEYVKALFGRRKGEAIEWYGGVAYSRGTGPRGDNYSALFPIGRILFPLNPRWEIGGSFEPSVQLASNLVLAELNPYYAAPAAYRTRRRDTAVFGFDSRSVVIDRFNLAGFMNYMLSADDEIHAEARFVTRDNEPVFEQRLLADSQSVFLVTPQSTRRLQLIFSGNFLVLTRDVLTAGLEFHSATVVGADRGIPFEPTLKLTTAYHFNSLSESIKPAVEFRTISRKDKNMSFLNAEARVAVADHLSILARVENILGGESDFWPGYSELPRTFRAAVRYAY